MTKKEAEEAIIPEEEIEEVKQGKGEAIGGIDKTRQMKKETKCPGREAIPGEELEPKEAKP